ncbi:MAG: efflux RND transporter periplasmic adaptor subunit [Deltaproteobacteria bacterium]|nr:efflux RND transporter periplasmic adaptor subunit [Deltaproteobacteria bacterium]
MTSKKPFNKKLLLPVPLILIAIIAYFFLGRKSEFHYVGTVEATKTDISSRISSVISSFPAREGSRVKKGDLLVQMACEDTKLILDSTKKDFERAERLFRIGSLSQENFDHLKTKKDESSLKMDWCSIVALKDTSVLNTYREEGEYVNPGTKLLTLVNLSEVWTVIYVPQLVLSQISIGKKVTGFLPELNMRPFEGKISYISDAAEFTPKNVQTREERTRLVFGVKITFVNPDELLKPGMSLEVKLE